VELVTAVAFLLCQRRDLRIRDRSRVGYRAYRILRAGSNQMSFAVIDFETTGLVPERTDRVIEVGIVLVDLDGRMESEWTTLVSPSRDVGASHIHGLTAADLLDAPQFTEVAD